MSADLPGRLHCGVLGSPIEHSLSPVLHRAAYRELGLDWEYDAHDVTEERLPGFLRGLGPDWRGLSLTMPLKAAVIDWCDEVEDLGRLLRSVNTVVIGASGWRAFNTDVPGMADALRAHGVQQVDHAVVVGSGATAASALAALALLGGHHVTVAARSLERASVLGGLGPALGLDVRLVALDDVPDLTATDVVVSTIPAAAQPGVATALAGLAAVVFDVTYHPRETPLLVAAREAGRTTVEGFELLLHQAARQVELMTGSRPAPLEAMRDAGLQALSP